MERCLYKHLNEWSMCVLKSVRVDQGKGQRPESNTGIRTEEKVKMFLKNQQHQPIEVSRYFWMCGVDSAAFMPSL